jgi:hypothetical protein
MYQPSKEARNLVTVNPTRLSVDLVERNSDWIDWDHPIYSLNGTTFTILSPQPLLLTSCSESENIQDENIYSIDKSKKLLVNPLAQYESLKLGNETSVFDNYILFTSAVDDAYTLVALTRAPGDDFNNCTVCTVNAFWGIAKTTISNNGVTQAKTEMPHQVPNVLNKNFKPIQISPTLPKMSGLWPAGAYLSDALLGLYIAYALATIPEVEPNVYADKFQGYDLSQLEGQPNITPFRIDTLNYGFGYGTRDTPTDLSVTAITAYCLIVVFYIGYIITTGHASIAWNSPTELIMLALQSKEPTDLGHVSVGVDSMDTLRRNVGIRVSTVDIQGTGETREKLELVFEDDKETEKRGLTKVVRNRAY